MTGGAFSLDHLFRWGYNDRSELTTVERDEGTDPQDPGDIMNPGYWTYAYDPIGNRAGDSVGPYATVNRSYCANSLNQYTATHDGTDNCPNPTTPTESFTYDADGNLTQDGQFVYTWDGENRLIGVAPASSPVNGDKKLAFAYDYMNRRVQKKVWNWQSGNWVLATDQRFVYDGWNVVLVLDGLDDNAILTKYTWGLDLSGQRGSGVAPGVSPVVSGIHGAGGIGGLLAVEETALGGTPMYWFLYDANGNVTQLVKNDANSYPLTAHYEYDAYGHAIVADDMDSSGYVDTNPLRFSTKWFDGESGMGNWGQRPYGPTIGRWFTRDPLEEHGFTLVSRLVEAPALPMFDRLTSALARLKSLGISTPMIDDWVQPTGSALSEGDHHFDSDSVRAALYSYVANRPSNAYDPLGLRGCCDSCSTSLTSCDYYKCRAEQTTGNAREIYQVNYEVCSSAPTQVWPGINEYRECLQKCDKDICSSGGWVAFSMGFCHAACLPLLGKPGHW